MGLRFAALATLGAALGAQVLFAAVAALRCTAARVRSAFSPPQPPSKPPAAAAASPAAVEVAPPAMAPAASAALTAAKEPPTAFAADALPAATAWIGARAFDVVCQLSFYTTRGAVAAIE